MSAGSHIPSTDLQVQTSIEEREIDYALKPDRLAGPRRWFLY
jgi:hypothetical protein